MPKHINLPISIFANRIQECAILKETIMDTVTSEHIITVRGNIGLGKTKLVQEVLKAIEWRDVIWGECSYLADYVAYYVIRELVKSQLQIHGLSTLSDIKASYKRIVGKLVPEAMDEEAEQIKGTDKLDDKFTFYEGIRQIIDRGARAKIIVVDNSQWIDQASMNLLRFLIKAEKRQYTTFVFIYRMDEEVEVLTKFLDAVRKEHKVTDIEIKAFSLDDVAVILESIIDEKPDDRFLNYVYRWSGGNPFYIEEITSTLVLNGHLVLDHDHWVFREPKAGSVPKTIADIATTKYLSLSHGAQRILDIASVIGWFDIPIMQEILEMQSVEIVEHIEEIDAVGMIHYGEERVEFSDEISRNAVYSQVAKKEDVKILHQRVGDSIKLRSQANEKAVIHELAFHYYHGMDREKGVRFCTQAGDRAHENYAHQEAIQYYTWAMEMLAGTERREKIELIIDCLRKRIEVYGILGEHEHALADIQEALNKMNKIHDATGIMDMIQTKAQILFQLSKPHDAAMQAEHVMALAQEKKDLQRVARAMMLRANIHMHFRDFSSALNMYNEALSYFERVDDRKSMSTINSYMGVLYRRSGKFENAREAHERALALAQQIDDKQTIAACLIGMGNLHHIMGNYEQSLTSFEEAHLMNKEIGYRQGIAIACGSISNAYTALGQYRKALRYLRNSMKMKRGIEDRKNEAGDHANIAGIYSKLGEYTKAINEFESALRIVRDIEESAFEVYILDHLGSVYYYLGNFKYADSLHQQAYVLIKKKNLEIGEFYNLLLRGRLYLTQEKKSEAKMLIDSAYNAAVRLGSKTMMMDAALLLCEYYLEQNETVLFTKHIEKIVEPSAGNLTSSYSGHRDLLVGRFHSLKNEIETAEKVLHSALRIFEKLEEQYNIGQTYAYLGMLEKQKGASADPRPYLITARGIFEAIGAKFWKEKVDALLNDAPDEVKS